MSKETELLLVNLLLKLSTYERLVDVVMQVLSNQPNFDPYSLFQRLDRDKKGFLVLEDFKKFMMYYYKENIILHLMIIHFIMYFFFGAPMI